MKTCTACHEGKEPEAFYKSRVQPCKECCRDYERAKYASSPARRIQAVRDYRQLNPEKVAAGDKRYREANQDAVRIRRKKWRAANPEKVKFYDALNRQRRRRYIRSLTSQEWADTLLEFEGRCFYCGEPGLTMDHIVPLTPRAGTPQGHHTKTNVVPACLPCNSRKNNRDPLLFLFSMREK